VVAHVAGIQDDEVLRRRSFIVARTISFSSRGEWFWGKRLGYRGKAAGFSNWQAVQAGRARDKKAFQPSFTALFLAAVVYFLPQ